MLVFVWRRLDASFARCALPLAALCAGDATSAVLAGSAALASALPLQWMWIPVVSVCAYATLYSVRALAAITAALVAIGLVERQRHWRELGVGSDEGVILVQGVVLGLWRGALTVTEALSDGQLVREASATSASPQDICAAVALLVGGTCLTWLLVLPILWTQSRKRSSSGPAENSSALKSSGLGWAENAWVWCCLVGVVAGVEYPMLWMRLRSEPFTWALSILCGTPALVGLVVWWCAVVAVLVAFTPPRERPHLRYSNTEEDLTTHRGTAPVLLHPARTTESAEQDQGRAVSAPRTHDSARRSLSCDSLRRAASRLSPHQALLIVRKFFHAAAVAMFAPALFVRGGTGSLALAFACAAKVLCTLELLRASRAHPLWLSRSVHVFVHGFTDGRDSGALVLTHLYLLLGCAAPLWLWLGTRLEGGGGDVLLLHAEGPAGSERGSPGLQALPPAAALGAAPLAGIAVLGAGDAAAAAVGIFATALGCAHTWGWALGACSTPPWQQPPARAAVAPAAWAGARKTLEGSAAFVIAVLICLGVVDAVLVGITGLPQQQQQPWGAAVARWARVACCTTLASLLETFTHAIDNATLPAAFYVCIEWAGVS